MSSASNEITSKREAQQRADTIRALREELARLQRQGILVLSDEQRRSVDRNLDQTLTFLANRFDIDTTESEKQVSWGMRIASTIGGLALCAAVFLFFYRFWGLLATPVQIAILILTPICLVLAAEFAARRERTLYFASLISLVAFAAFIMNLSVLGSIFNLAPSPGAFLAWGLFALALAYHFRLRLPLAAALVCLMIWLAAVVATWSGTYWVELMEAPEPLILAGLVTLAVAFTAKHGSYPEFPAVYRLLGLLAVFLSILALSLKISRSYLLISEKNTAVLYQASGMLVAAAAIWFGITRRFTGVVNLAATFFVIFLYCRFVAWWWDWMPKYLFFLIIGLISLGLLAVFRKIRLRLQEVRAI